MGELEESMSRQWRFTPNSVMQVRMVNYMKMIGLESKAELLKMAVNYFLQDHEKNAAEKVFGRSKS